MNPKFDKPFTFDRVVRLLVSLIVLISLFLLFRRLSGVLVPFFVAWLIAYLLNPAVNFFQNTLRFRIRIIAVLTTLILFIALLVTGVYLLTAPITKEIIEMSSLVANFAQSQQDLSFLPDSWELYLKETASMEKVQEFFTIEKITSLSQEILPRVWTLISGSFNILSSLAVAFIMTLYIIFILLDFENISKGWIKLVPDKYREMTSVFAEDVKFSMNKYYRNQAMIALIVGTLFTIGFNIIGLPLATVMGVIVLILNFIPYMQTFAIPPIIFLVFLKSVQTDQSFLMGLLLFGIVFGVVQALQDGFLVPRVMGKAMGLNPAVVVLSLTIWGSLLGILGMIIALPFTSMLTTYYRRFVLYEDKEGEAFSTNNPPPKNEDIIK